MKRALTILLQYLPFWLFLALFKFGGGLHYTLMSPYGVQFLPVWLVGLLIGAASFAQLLFDVPAGYLLDRYGYLPMLRLTTLAFFIGSVFIALGLTEMTFLLSLAASTLGWQFYDPGASAYILSHATDEESGRYFSLRDTFCSIGIVFASIALPFALLLASKNAGLLLCTLFFAAYVVLLFAPVDFIRVKLEEKPHVSRRKKPLQTLWKGINSLNPASGMLVLLTLASSIFYGVIWFVVPLVISQEQSVAGVLSIGLGIFDFSVVVLGYLIGTIADKAEKRTLIFFGLLLFSICGMLLGLSFGILFIFFGFMATTGDEMAGISLWSWMHKLDKEHAQDGVVAGVITLFQDLGWAIGPALAGVLFMAVGPALAIALGAVPIFLVWIVYYFFVHRHFPADWLRLITNVPYRPHRRRHKS